MKNAVRFLIIGALLILLCPILMRGVTELRPVRDSQGHLVMKDGRQVLEYDRTRTILVNLDAWLCFLGGVVCIAIGGVKIIKNYDKPPTLRR